MDTASPAPTHKTLDKVDGYSDARIYVKGSETIVALKKTDGTKSYWVTITFRQPIDEANIRSYLSTKDTKEKIEQLIKQFDTFASIYGDKKKFRLESDVRPQIFYENKKGGLKKLDISENNYQHSLYNKAEELKKKIESPDHVEKKEAQKEKQKKMRSLIYDSAIAALFKTLPTPPQPNLAKPVVNVATQPPSS